MKNIFPRYIIHSLVSVIFLTTYRARDVDFFKRVWRNIWSLKIVLQHWSPVFFSFWFSLLCMTASRSIHVSANGTSLFLFLKKICDTSLHCRSLGLRGIIGNHLFQFSHFTDGKAKVQKGRMGLLKVTSWVSYKAWGKIQFSCFVTQISFLSPMLPLTVHSVSLCWAPTRHHELCCC